MRSCARWSAAAERSGGTGILNGGLQSGMVGLVAGTQPALRCAAGCSEVLLQEVRFGALGSCISQYLYVHVFLDH